MKPRTMTAIINRKRYSTATATLLAGNDHWDGHNYERHGRNSFLYRTPKGSYSHVNLTCWEGEEDSIVPVSVDEAIEFFECCPERVQRVTYAKAFPDVTVEEA